MTTTTQMPNNTSYARILTLPFAMNATNRNQGPSMSVDVTVMEHFETVDFEPKSKSIPIQKYIQRTPSELQLHEDEAVADYRDYCMYSRIVSGITRQQMKQHDLRQRYQNDLTIENIMRTRHEPRHQEPSLTNQRIMNILYQASVEMDDDWAPDLVEARSSNETDLEQSETLFELEL